MANSNGARSSGILDKLLESLDNRIILLLVAGLLGTGGGTLIQASEPAARSDPFTGAMGKLLELRIEQLERTQELDVEHRKKADQGYERIRNLEQGLATQVQVTHGMMKEITQVREECRDIKRHISEKR